MVQLDSTRQLEPTADQEAEFKPEEDRCSRLGRRCGYATRGSMRHPVSAPCHRGSLVLSALVEMPY